MKLDLNEFIISYVRSSGPGGQNVNKVNSKCVLKWSPTSSRAVSDAVIERFVEKYKKRISSDGCVVISSDRYRDQKRNFDDCVSKLKEMISTVINAPIERKKTKASRSSQKKRIDKKRVHSDKKKMRRSSRHWE